jgi:hypothetical protein
MLRYNRTERLGVAAVQQITTLDLGWVFREQSTVDLGIDAHIELVEENLATGKLIALQIKTGRSHFHEAPNALIYYGDMVHVKYWAGYSLPMILVAHLPDTDETFWVRVNANTRSKIIIPKRNRFGQATERELVSLFDSRVFCIRPRGLSPADIPSVISRQELAERFGGSLQLCISVSSWSPDVFLICVTELGKYFDFDDGWKDDGCFHYSGQRLTAGQQLRAGNLTIAEAAKNGRSLHLFHGPRGAYEYQGKFELDPDHPYCWTYPLATCRTPQQKIIVFRLRPLERPANPAPDHKRPFRSWSSQRLKHYVRPGWSVPQDQPATTR